MTDATVTRQMVTQWRRQRYVMPDDPMPTDQNNATMRHAQSLCVQCKLCGGSAVIEDAGTGWDYTIRCSGAEPYAKPKCLCTGVRISGDAYNVMLLWNEMHTPDPREDGYIAGVRAAAEVMRLRAVLEDIANGMGETSAAEIGRYAPHVARAALLDAPAPEEDAYENEAADRAAQMLIHGSGMTLPDAPALPDARAGAVEPVAWRVKPLEWENCGLPHGDAVRARSPVTGDEYAAASSVDKARIGEFRLRGPWRGFTYHPSMEAAKAAAQADYEARILSALEPTPACTGTDGHQRHPLLRTAADQERG